MEWEMASVNKIILIGTVTSAPDFRVLGSGSMMVSLKMETVFEDESQSHDVTFYGRLGEIVTQYVEEGSLIYVEGKLRSGKYEDKAGTERLVTGIVAQKMQMLGRKKEDDVGTGDLFSADNPYKKAKEGTFDPPDLSKFDYDDW